MQLAKVYSRARLGIEAPLITTEVHIANGLPAFTLVGLPEASVRESRDRVRSALINSGFDFPQRRITINLAPADLPKEGSRFDLAIALGILTASGQLKQAQVEHFEFLGELSLGGEVRAVSAALPAAIQCEQAGRTLILPEHNAREVLPFVSRLPIAANALNDVVAALTRSDFAPMPLAPLGTAPSDASCHADFADIVGQHSCRRALEIAAVGNHNLLLSGPPGTGKTLMASRLPGILPPMSREEMLQTCSVYSVAGKGELLPERRRPFRAPHHTASAVALVGGGHQVRPGEVSLAHGGVLFLDELPEFPRKVLEVLREPLESGEISIARANMHVTFPAQFQLIATMNPCPCGYYGDPHHDCRCTPDQVNRYRNRISGPLLDRIDLFVPVPRLPPGSLHQQERAECSAAIQARVMRAREFQSARGQTGSNAQLSLQARQRWCQLGKDSHSLLLTAETRLGLSARAQHRIIKVARSIADLAQSETVSLQHLSEALSYREQTHSRC